MVSSETDFDYTYKIFINGMAHDIGYQAIIKELDLEQMELGGAPLHQGGAPQAMSLKILLEKILREKGATSDIIVELYHDGHLIG